MMQRSVSQEAGTCGKAMAPQDRNDSAKPMEKLVFRWSATTGACRNQMPAGTYHVRHQGTASIWKCLVSVGPGMYKITMGRWVDALIWFMCKMISLDSEIHDRPAYLQHHTSRLPAKRHLVPSRLVQSRPSRKCGCLPAACPSAEPQRSGRRRSAPAPTPRFGRHMQHAIRKHTHIAASTLHTSRIDS